MKNLTLETRAQNISIGTSIACITRKQLWHEPLSEANFCNSIVQYITSPDSADQALQQQFACPFVPTNDVHARTWPYKKGVEAARDSLIKVFAAAAGLSQAEPAGLASESKAGSDEGGGGGGDFCGGAGGEGYEAGPRTEPRPSRGVNIQDNRTCSHDCYKQLPLAVKRYA